MRKIFCTICDPHLCSMKISQDVRDFAAKERINEAAAPSKGMELKAAEFVEQGGSIYRKA